MISKEPAKGRIVQTDPCHIILIDKNIVLVKMCQWTMRRILVRAMSQPPDHDIERAAKAWRLMFEFLMRSTPQRLRSQQKLGLTPNDSRALFSLDKNGKPIGMLAREWVCDPSTATWLVDRLERAGLAERVPLAGDRRVKLVRVTKKGAATMKQLMAAYHQPPPEMTDISPHDLDQVIRIFSKLPAQDS